MPLTIVKETRELLGINTWVGKIRTLTGVGTSPPPITIATTTITLQCFLVALFPRNRIISPTSLQGFRCRLCKVKMQVFLIQLIHGIPTTWFCVSSVDKTWNISHEFPRTKRPHSRTHVNQVRHNAGSKETMVEKCSVWSDVASPAVLHRLTNYLHTYGDRYLQLKQRSCIPPL